MGVKASHCNGGLRIKKQIYMNDEIMDLNLKSKTDTIVATQKYDKMKIDKDKKQYESRVYTYNCRTLKDNIKLLELLEEMKNVQWDLIGLSEVRRNGEECLELTDGIKFYYNGTGSTGGTGFLVNKNIAKQITSFKGYSQRVSRILWKPGNKKIGRVKIIQVYAPTSEAEEDEFEAFYNSLQDAIDDDTSRYTIIMGDWNSKLGKGSEKEKAVGQFGLGERNRSGERMMEFIEANNLFVMNTFFKKNTERKWTWISPDGRTKNEIDYIVSNSKKYIKDVDIENNVNIGSDHRVVKAVLKIGERRIFTQCNKKLEINQESLKRNNYTEKITERLNEMVVDELELNKMEGRIVKAITETTGKVLNEVADKKTRKFPENIKKLMQKRRRLKRKGKEKIEFAEISKNIRKLMNKWSYNKNIEELEEAIKIGSSLKKCKRSQQIGRKAIIAMKDDSGTIWREEEKILNIISEFYMQLYTPPGDINEDIYEYVKCNQEDNIIDILPCEVEAAIKSTKCGKTGGLDNIVNEQVKLGGERLMKDLCQLYNCCLKEQKVPTSWLESKLMLLFKKGDKLDIRNYRPINLLSVIYKIFMSIITRRITAQLDFDSPVDQVGFKKNFSTNDAILVIQQLISKAQDYQFTVFFLFIDFEKAFDSVSHEALFKALKINMIDESYTNIFRYIYKNATMRVNVGNKFKSIKLERGLRQGDVPSAKLFGCILEEAFKRCNWKQYGININGEKLNVMKFADDVILIGKSQDEILKMVTELKGQAESIGLKINCKKTKIMKINSTEDLLMELDGKRIDEVNEFIYLGQAINPEEGVSKEINRRIGIGWGAYNKHRKLFRAEIEMQSKMKLWNCVVRPTITYACETWPLTISNITKIRRATRAMERSMLKVSRRERMSNRWIRTQTGMEDIGKTIGKKKWKWAGHIIRTQDNRWTKKILEWRPMELKRKIGRPKLKWDHEMKKICGGASWKRVALDRSEWKRLSDVFVEVWIPEEV